MKSILSIVAVVLLASSLGAQNTLGVAELRSLNVQDADGVKIELSLSSPVLPRASLLTHPDRLLVELPNAVPNVKHQRISVNRDGVKRVDLNLQPGSPATTQLTVLLSHSRAYDLTTEGNKIFVSILPESAAKGRRNGPTGAASVPLLGRLWRSKPAAVPQVADSAPTQVKAPPAFPPLTSPAAQSSTASSNQSSSTSSSSTASASAQPPVSVETSAKAADQDPALATRQPNSDIQVAFRVKYVAEGAAYLEGGRNQGLAEGMKLVVRDRDPNSGQPIAQGEDVAQLQVSSLALSSAVTDISNPKRDVKAGDWAYLSAEDTGNLVAQRSLSATRKYPAVISFTLGDPLDEEERAAVPRPPLPEINRARGRIGFDYSGIASHGSGFSSNVGLMTRMDITRINGTYWNLSGYWRGRLSSRSSTGQPTIQDLINRTYHLGLTYDNPNSPWVAGFGRLYLPWASSLDTIDGGYFGRRVSKSATAGIFAGSTPDPTSWSYNPDRRIGGAFVNFEGGSFDGTRYTSTSGLGLSMLKSQIDRPFVFFENGIFYKRYLSIYHSLQADSPRGNAAVAAPGAGISRSFLTVRLQPYTRLEFEFNHTYFRDLPTFDPQLVGTGLLDKYLFQGFSAGTRVEVAKNIWVYTTLGRSNRSGDTHASLNQLYGLTLGHLPWTDIRADLHYSRFNSAFGSGSYESVSLSRNFRENLRWEVLAGKQSFASLVTSNSSHFVTGNFEAALGRNYFVQSGYTWNRGGLQNYDQWIFTFGYRFDSKSKAK